MRVVSDVSVVVIVDEAVVRDGAIGENDGGDEQKRKQQGARSGCEEKTGSRDVGLL
jgi:hypothetical protein